MRPRTSPASRATAASTAAREKPCGPHGTAMQASACCAVSRSAKRSSTITRSPARAAAAARARPDSAAISAGGALRDEVERGLVGIAEIETLGLFCFEDALQQRVLHAELDVADGERADADAGRARDRRAIGLDVHTLDAERWNGVDVGRDLEAQRGAKLGRREDLHAGLGRGEHHVAILEHGAASGFGAAIGDGEGTAEALLKFRGLGRNDAAAIV